MWESKFGDVKKSVTGFDRLEVPVLVATEELPPIDGCFGGEQNILLSNSGALSLATTDVGV